MYAQRLVLSVVCVFTFSYYSSQYIQQNNTFSRVQFSVNRKKY